MRKLISFLCALCLACGMAHAGDGTAQESAIVAAIRIGHYADAIALIRQSDYTCAEREFSVGEMILQGWSDRQAQQRPTETVEIAIGLLEKSALRGHQQAISSLAGLFYTGLKDDANGKPLVMAQAALQSCWEVAKQTPAQAKRCVAMRVREAATK